MATTKYEDVLPPAALEVLPNILVRICMHVCMCEAVGSD